MIEFFAMVLGVGAVFVMGYVAGTKGAKCPWCSSVDERAKGKRG